MAAFVFAAGVVALVEVALHPDRMRSAAVRHFGGPFQLVDQSGRPFTDRDLRAHPTVLFFGYTHCPDICPTALADLSRWQGALGQDADRLQFVFVTVDPDRDTPSVLRDFLKDFPGRFIALSGPPAKVRAMLKSYPITADRASETNGGYSVDHTSSVFLVDGGGRLDGVLSLEDDQSYAVAKLHEFVEGAM